MKTNHLSAIPAAALLAVALAPSIRAQGNNANLTIPVGWLTAFPTVVQTGTHPTLTWDIKYPSLVQDFVNVGGGGGGSGGGGEVGTLTPLTTLDAEVRVIGAGVTVTYSNGTWAYVPTEAQMSYGDGPYNQIFFNRNDRVNPSKALWKGEVTAGKKIRFGGRYRFNNQWGNYYNSQSGTNNIRTLVNGDIPPTLTPMAGPSLEEFVAPYLDPEGKVKIGPMDVIVFMELTHTDAQVSNPGYDLQDMVLLVSFKVKSNNGHGNNVDGVDSSNPGNAPFVDSDPTVDDEGGGGGAYPSKKSN